MGLAYWFIRYQFDQNAAERVEYKQLDAANERRAFELAERSNEAMHKLYEAVAQEYQGHSAFSKPTWQRAEMKSRGEYREPTDI